MMQLFIEMIIVGIVNAIVGFIVSYLSMGSKASEFTHWNSILFSFFICGVIIHLSFELTGLNKKYCKNGYACTH
jgi:uncharacterized membrane protein YvlD (DUF360 family)